MIPKPVQVKAIKEFEIWLKYDDNTEGTVNLSHLQGKPVFKNWDSPGFFQKVYIDKETQAIAWDANIELCADSLYFKILGISFDQWKAKQYHAAS